MDSVVFLNGKQVASHPYGYTGFAVDLKDAHADGHTKNVVAVEVRNKLPSSRWYSGSGIYRNVHLVVTDPVHVARHGTFVTTPDVESTFKQGFANVHVRTDVAGATDATSVVTSVQDARGRTVAGGRPATPQDGSATSDLRLSHPHLWSTDDPYLYTLTTEVRQGRRTVDRTTTTFGVRWFHFDPAQGFSLNGQLHEAPGRRPAPRRGRPRRGGQQGRAHAPDAHHEEHGRQRLPHLAQPALAGDDRGLPGARHRDDGRGLRHLAHAQAPVRLRALLRRQQRHRHRRDGQRGQELAGRRAVVDRQRDPRLDLGHRRPADRQAPGRRHQGDRHHAPDRHRLGQVPQRPGHRLGRRPDPRPARRPRAELQHRRLGRRAARQVPQHVPLRVRVVLGDVDARRLPGPRPAQHRRELHAGQARDVVLRQQPRLLDDERRVRPEEGPRPQVLPGPVPVVGHRLHRRADAVQRVPGQVVVLRRGRHRGLPQGRLLALPQPVDEGPDGPSACR